ncbi:haloacid dehalogenase-like hydrolase domain-containing 5 isoform X1 [Littorina saxatilis]|uniref:haloacid dehalogenase-like hydrolase domain-containing 5 isoform X1 n=1 Tax=Littorina saxatilis TaxID=31220 RepID=UPI0038B46732
MQTGRLLLGLRSLTKCRFAVINASIWPVKTSSAFSTWQLPLKPDFGILFDVDGVLARGSNPLDQAKKAMEKLKDANGHLRVPCAFVTNACNRSHDKALQISNWFDMEVSPDQVIHAPTPVKLLREVHDKQTLVIGQEHRLDIAKDLGFDNLCTIEDVKEAYPLLDMVDHENRVKVAKGQYKENPSFPRVEAILLIGEPTHWESNLQLLLDLLLTQGKPTEAPTDVHTVPQIPVIACNMDLVFMAEACMPRFGHGAFLLCLEALFKKITGNELHYVSLVGKPCEITYRFAEHTVSKIAKRMGINKPIKRLYFFGDNPHVDIVGANLYDRYIKQNALNLQNGNTTSTGDSADEDACSVSSVDSASSLPSSRIIPENAELHDQTVEHCLSMLVGTGVYKYGTEMNKKGPDGKYVYHGHRDIAHEPELTNPHKYVHCVDKGIDYIFERESMVAL